MTRMKRHSRLTVPALAGAVLLTACGTHGTADATTPEPVSIAIGEPAAPLVPGNTVEEYGTQILESLWTGLVEYGTDGEVGYTGVAESITSPDSTAWTITLEGAGPWTSPAP